MIMKDMFDLLESVRRESGSKKKTELLSSIFKGATGPLFADYILAVIDPNTNYYTAQVPDETELGHTLSLDQIEAINSLDLSTTTALIQFLNEFIASRMYTGHQSRDALILINEKMDEYGKSLLSTILSRDLLIGAQVKTLNKAYGGTLVYVPPYMRCSSFNRKNLDKVSFPLLSQTKMDGLFVNIIVNGEVTIMSRSGQIMTDKLLTEELKTSLINFYEERGAFVLQGEAVAFYPDSTDIMPRTEGNGYLNSDDIDPERVCFVAWDLLPFDDFKRRSSDVEYTVRLANCEGCVTGVNDKGLRLIDTTVCTSVDDVVAHFRIARENGEEGTVVKTFVTKWKDGTSTEMIKIKVEFDCDLKIVGIEEGKNANEGRLGAFIVESCDGVIRTNVGGGFTNSERDELFTQDVVGLITKVRANDILTSDGKDTLALFLPRFKGLRYDKNEADSCERVKEQLDAFIDALKLLE